MRRIRFIVVVLFCCIRLSPVSAQNAAPPAGIQDNVHFPAYGNLARSSEVMRRVFSPLTGATIRRDLARTGKTLNETSIDLNDESFLVYIPHQKPAGGYRLLVFVPPWQKAQLPQGWGPVLDGAGVMFVTASRSGNEEDIVSRREPLAVIAAENLLAQYDIDRTQIYVGGMSGGSRMALRLALAYPDLFRGAFLNSGSDVIGTLVEPLPPAPLFHQFQTGTRLLYVTGDHDAANLEQETRSRLSMRAWCVSDIGTIRMAFTGHEVAPAAVLKRALDQLLAPERPDPAALADCRARIEADVAGQLDQVETLIGSGKLGDAKSLLKDIDGKYGGLAAPRSLDLNAASEK
jgi:pimeloyl-ACP methyl ester carboxylesterase